MVSPAKAYIPQLEQVTPSSFSYKPTNATKSSFTSGSKPQANSTVYLVGQTVIHKTFGKGMIISVTPMGNDSLLEIAFENVGTKKIMAGFAKLIIS